MLIDEKNRISSLIIKTFIFVVFWLVTLIAIIHSMGLDIDWRNWQVQQTGIVFLGSSTNRVSARVELTGQLVKDKIPATFDKLKPGLYQATVNKAGYVTWRKSFTVKPSEVAAWKSVLLIKKSPIIRPATEEERGELALEQKRIADETIIIEANELFIKNEKKTLVTRFSDDIDQAIWYPDGEHIVYQIKNKINIIEIDGKNSTQLVKLSSDDPTVFRLLKKGRELLYQDGERVLVAEITD